MIFSTAGEGEELAIARPAPKRRESCSLVTCLRKRVTINNCILDLAETKSVA